ncbi:MAG TPA: zf-HC2 domain-containing protein [Sedimentisphaerales bacterium]|nr:zf-HC2 domain-containing protein [Sedimentisphaerales bacterium]
MNCAECKELLVGYIEELLEDRQKQAIESHLEGCPPCRAELTQLTGLRERLTANGKALAQRNLENKVIDRILREQSLNKLGKTKKVDRQFQLWRKIMKSKITKFATAAAIIIVAAISITLLDKSVPTASASELLNQAIQAVANIRSVHIQARMRTIPHDNFGLIGLSYDFVPMKMWKWLDNEGRLQWRIEKPGRVEVMDSNSTIMLIRPNYAVKIGPLPAGRYAFDAWCGHLMDVDNLLDSELRKALKHPDGEISIYRKIVNGQEKVVLEIYASAQGDYTNDYLRNKFISESDHTRVYYFDAETKLLTGFEIYVHTGKEDVIVFETTAIEYNLEIDPALFTLELPKDVIWHGWPKVLENNEKYQQMTPKEMAIAFFQACADEDWDEFLKFWSASAVDERMKSYLGGLEIISIGEPFKSGLYPGWFVPYEIRLKSGKTKKFNLAVRNDNPAKRYIVDGGI